MEQKRPRWVDGPEFDWTPNPPFEPSASAQIESETGPVIIDASFAEPAPQFAPANDAPPEPSFVSRWMPRFIGRGLDQFVVHLWQLGSRSGAARERFALPAIAPRLAIGLGQGLLLCILFYFRDHTTWSGVVAGLIMATTFAPLLLVQGLGRIPRRPLLIWTCLAALGLAGLGAYHYWRVGSSDAGHAGLWLVAMIAIFLFIGQALLLGHARSGPGQIRYAVLYESSWRLAIETALCGLFALLVWSLCRLCQGWLPDHATPQPFLNPVIPLVTLSFAVAAQLRAGTTLHLLKRGTVIGFTMTLPLLILCATATVLFASLSRSQPSFGLCAIEGVLLVIAINASYRGGEEWRPQWRRYAEFLAACLLPPLALLGVLALQSRTAQYGFTGPRIIAMACMMLFIAYALTYAGAALISLGGGRWMERIESVNLPLAFVAMTLFATLASPIGDPVRLAVANQNWRMLHGRIAPEAFDYDYLRRSGLRFGRAVLEGRR